MIEPMAPHSYRGRATVMQPSLMGAGAVTTEMMAAGHAVAPGFIEPTSEPGDATIEYSALDLETEESPAWADDSAPPHALRDAGYAGGRTGAEADWITAEDVSAEMAESHAGEYLAAENLAAEEVAAQDRVDARGWPDQRFEFAREEDVTDVAEPPIASSFDEAVAAGAMPGPPRTIEAEPVDAGSEGFVAATDPWQNPLPAWEYSQNEWPVVLAPKKERRHKKRLTLIAAVLLLALLAGLYFLVTRPGADATPKDDKAQLAEPAAAPSASPQEQSPPAAISAAARSTPEPAAPQQPTTQQAATQQATPEQPAPSGRYSLQASASPSQAEAEDFAARLRQAGLPAYVLSADLGRKGVWYRVRVGGFESAQDAARFVAQAKERARAAGVALKGLNVVEN